MYNTDTDNYIPIYTVLGKSGAGKSTVVDSIMCDDTEYDFKKIKPYTTRPKRHKYEDDYHFMTRSILDMYTSTDEIIRRYIKDEKVISDISYNVNNGKVWRYILTYDESIYRQDRRLKFILAASIGQFMDMYSNYVLSKHLNTDRLPVKPIPVVVEAIDDKERLKHLFRRASSNSSYKEILRRDLFGEEIPDNYMDIFYELGYTNDEIYVIKNNYDLSDLHRTIIEEFLNKLYRRTTGSNENISDNTIQPIW